MPRIGLVYIASLVPRTQYGVRVHDSDVPVPATSGVATSGASSDVAWVSEAYDSFAGALYAYCRSLVREPAAAADAVRDTFVVTAFRLDDLPHEGLLRPWLYAVARNECLRAIGDGRATPAIDFLPDEATTDSLPDQLPAGDEAASGTEAGTGPGSSDETSPDVMAGDTENIRALLRAALGGLDPAGRDLMVMAWHGLDITECAVVLGTSRDSVFKAFNRARDQLGQCVGTLVVAHSQRRECEPLNAMLDGWDERLTPRLSSELRQHIDHCDTCASARRGGPDPAVLQLSPDPLRTMAATAAMSRLTAWVTSRLREQVLAAAFDQEPQSFENRAMVVRRAGAFRGDGFPVALAPAGLTEGRRHRSPLLLALAGTGAVGLAAVIAVAALALSGNHSTGIMQAWVGVSHPTVTTPSGGVNGSATRTQGARATASPSRTATIATPSTTPGSKPSASGKPSARPSTSASGGPGSSSPAAPPTSAAAVKPELSVTPTSLTLQQSWGGSSGRLELTNPTSSAIDWSISIPGGSHLAVRGPSSGQLQPGQQARLFIYQQGWGGDRSTAVVTINPGNIQVSVTIP